ncbi:MAG: hypothetical protein KF678_11575 [Phycisphaeraceae bacterium]|nr:hypothetical protein [Phycisphaeraceae bacterium]
METMRFERILKAALVVVAIIAAVVIFSANLSRGMTKLSLVIGTIVVCFAWAIVDVTGNHFRVRRIGAAASLLGLQQHDITDARIIHAPEHKQTKFEPQLWVTGELGGAPIEIAAFEFQVGSGKNSKTYHNVQVIRPCAEGWPDLRLAPPRKFWRKPISKLLASNAAGLENPAFGKRWTLECADPDFALLLLSPEVQEWLLQAPKHERWTIESGRIALTHRRRATESDMPTMISRLDEFLAMIPAELQGYEPVRA